MVSLEFLRVKGPFETLNLKEDDSFHFLDDVGFLVSFI